MKCKICKLKRTEKVDDFTPYIDQEWFFEIYNCLDCKTRFAVRDTTISYHEIIHNSDSSPYDFHYKSADKVKKLLNSNIDECSVFLSNKSVVLKDLFSYIQGKPKSISILEIGCSTGYITAFLQKIGFTNTLGIDISTTAIEYASQIFGDYYAFNAEKKKYDIIFHTGLIGCVDEPIEFLHYYLNYLNDNGVMFFNAPNVDSVIETNELWVSTPPPDLIYLFKDESLQSVLGENYDIQLKKTFTPSNILHKYLNKYKNSKNNIYPRKFINTEKKRASIQRNKFLKKSVFFFISTLVRLKILKNYSDEYGLIVQIHKK